MVSYNEGPIGNAKTRGGRLLTSDEWDSAVKTPGSTRPAICSSGSKSPDDKKLVRQGGRDDSADTPQKDITFGWRSKL